jgi:STE20-related kinase adapter protein alpha
MLRNGCRLKAVHDFPEHYHTNLNWASRELLEQNLAGYDTRSDLYSLGITVCELANGVVPFQDMELTQMLLSKIDGTTPRLLDVNTVPELKEHQNMMKQQQLKLDGDVVGSADMQQISHMYFRDFSEHFHQFTATCLQYNPDARLSAEALITQPFFKQIKRKAKQPSLVQLLRPLSPINERKAAQFQNDRAVEELVRDMKHVEINTVQWTF